MKASITTRVFIWIGSFMGICTTFRLISNVSTEVSLVMKQLSVLNHTNFVQPNIKFCNKLVCEFDSFRVSSVTVNPPVILEFQRIVRQHKLVFQIVPVHTCDHVAIFTVLDFVFAVMGKIVVEHMEYL